MENSKENNANAEELIETINQENNIYNGLIDGIKEYVENKTKSSNFDKSYDGTVVGYGSKRGLKVVINGNEYDNIECIEDNYKVGDTVKLISPQNVFSDSYVVGIINKTSNEISSPTINWLDKFYPVGSVYLTMSDSFSPSNAFGGTWQKISEGRFLLGASIDVGAGSYGGTATHVHTLGGTTSGHVLTTSEIPRHYHHFNETYDAADESQPATYMGTSGSHYHDVTKQNVVTYVRNVYTTGGTAYSAISEAYSTGTSYYGYVPAHQTNSGGGHRHSFRVNGDTSANLNNTANLGGGSHSHDFSTTTNVQLGYDDAVTEADVMNAVYPPYLTCNMWQRTQ